MATTLNINIAFNGIQAFVKIVFQAFSGNNQNFKMLSGDYEQNGTNNRKFGRKAAWNELRMVKSAYLKYKRIHKITVLKSTANEQPVAWICIFHVEIMCGTY